MSRLVRLVAVSAVVLVALLLPTPAGAACQGPLLPGEACDDTIEETSTTGWVLVPLGIGIGGLMAGAYLAVESRSRRRQATGS